MFHEHLQGAAVSKKVSPLRIIDLKKRKNTEFFRANTFVNSFKVTDALEVVQSGVKSMNVSGYKTPPSVYDHYIFHLIYEGHGTYHVKNKTYNVGTNSIFLIRPHELISYQAATDHPYLYYWVGFRGSDAEKLVHLAQFSSDNLVMDGYDDPTIHRLFEAISQPNPQDEGSGLWKVGSLYQLFSLMIQKNQKPLTDRNRYFLTAIKAIEKNYRKADWTIQQAANEIGIHRSYLYRIFQEISGISMQSYLLQYRLDRAKTLLLQSSLSIQAISEVCGFNSASYFSKAFKTQYTQTPLQCRRSD